MPWQPLPQIAFAVAIHPFAAEGPADLPLELGDELYVIEQGGCNWDWFRGYLLAPPSLLVGLTSNKGETLEARVFSGIFPRSCVEVREILGDDASEAEPSQSLTIAEDNTTNPPCTQELKRLDLSKRKSCVKSKDNTKKSRKANYINSKHFSKNITRDPSVPKPPAPVPMLKIGDETPTSLEEPLVDEIASCLREWQSTNLHQLLLAGEYQLLDKMSALVVSLDKARKQLLYDFLTKHELTVLREKVVWELVRGNKLFGAEVIVRNPTERGRIMTGDDSAVNVARLQGLMSLLDEQPQTSIHDSQNLHHLLVDIKTVVGTRTENTTLVIYLAFKAPGKAAVSLSESYIVKVPPSGALTSLAKAGTMRTLFADLNSSDIGNATTPTNELYLVVRVQTTQQINEGGPDSGSASRDGQPGRLTPQTANSFSRAGRRSMMWGSRVQRSAFSRHCPNSSKITTIPESNESKSRSQETPPPATANANENNSIIRNFNRTVGIGALKLNDIMKEQEECERVMNIWALAPRSYENRIDSLEEVIRESCVIETSRRSERLQLHLKVFNTADSENLIKATPTLLSGITVTNKMGFSGAPKKPRSDIYFTIDEAFLPRQALLMRNNGSATPLPQGINGSSLQITLRVRDSSGSDLVDCIYPSSNSEPIRQWESTVVERGESWNQCVRLAIPASKVSTCHLYMTLSDIPNGPLATCHLPLWDQQAFIRDGHHSLFLYRYDEITSTSKGFEGKNGYLYQPWNCTKDDASKDEIVTDQVLLGLLKWKDLSATKIQQLLKQLVFVPEIEIVKLLNDVFNVIFGILVQQAGNDEFEDLIFSALVMVLGISQDRRFNLGPLIEKYTENQFHYPFVNPCLVRSFTRLLSKPLDPENSKTLRATFKVVKYIFIFIAHSRNQQKEKEAEIGIKTNCPSFTHTFTNIFKALNLMMQNNAPSLVGNKTLAVQHFHTWIPELARLLSEDEIIHITIEFMNSCSAVTGKLILYKLVLIINFSKLDLFSGSEYRKMLCANTVQWIAPHWEITDGPNEQWREQVRLCCSVVSSQAQSLTSEKGLYIPKIVKSYSSLLVVSKTLETDHMKFSLLFPTSYPFPSKNTSVAIHFDEALIELSAVLSEIILLPGGINFELEPDHADKLYQDILNVYLSILNREAFPSTWLTIHIYHHKSTIKILEFISNLLLEKHIPDPEDAENYNTELWSVFFTLLLKLIRSDALALETFPEQKRRAVWKIAGDVRETGAKLMQKTWEAIGWETSPDEKRRFKLFKMGGYQVQFVPSLVGPIVELCLSVHEHLRKVAVDILQIMIVSEWNLCEDISIIQTEMIDCLDRLFKSKPLTESILQRLFISELEALFAPASKIPDDPLYVAVQGLITNISEFLDLLVAVYGSDITGEATHMINALRLMEFLRDMRKDEILIRYIHQLSQLNLKSGNITEAGLSLRLHADLYDWNPTLILPALEDPEFPAQSQFDRKERIYFDMIKFLEDGGAWTSALCAYQELQKQYQENIYDFSKLARTQKAIGSIYETISKSEKLIPKYFRVVYKGLGFPPSLRDKEFIFEAQPNEKLAVFQDRLQAAHPKAQIITANDLEDAEGQFLQIFPLSPHKDLKHPVLQRVKVSHQVRDYLMSSFPQSFSVTYKRNTSGPVTEHSAEKIIYKTVDRFPTILRRSEIETVERVSLDAQETGLERILRKTAEMTVIEKRVLAGETEIAALLIDAIQISINAESNASISRYRDLLPKVCFDENDEEKRPELTALETALKTALIDYAIMIRRCLMMLSKPENHRLLGDVERDLLIQGGFESTFSPELKSYAFPNQHHISPTSVIEPNISWSLSSPRSPLSATAWRKSQLASGLQASYKSSGMELQDVSRMGKKRLSFFTKRQDLQESSPQLELNLQGFSTFNSDGNFDDSSSSTNMLKKDYTTSTTHGRAAPNLSEESHSKENLSNHEEEMSRLRGFMHNTTHGRSSRRKPKIQRDNDNSESDLARRSSTKHKQHGIDLNQGVAPSAKGGFEKMAVGVRKRFSFVGLGSMRIATGGLARNAVTEEN
ncbi:dedicator of cytokinesis domain-containing protein [Blumeria hordei DH14]|uniref:Dedicator of cytokinesis domain-containing protein n=1 Tax=Blumeria graminis f. sp. hordei (strain DH14) TaxID=546991 RepID=N1JQE1_BLUG1|nr:dedicator of cytokinesis domain-containing protein [Blumeria hordei DH14]